MLTVQPFDTEDEAVALANSTPYGLASGIQTSNLARAHRVAARLQAGIVWVNDWAMLDPAVPFGGVKDSGFGREYGPEALEAYTKVKSVVVSLTQSVTVQPGGDMSITTRAAVVESGGAPFTLLDVELDEPAPTRPSSVWSPPACATRTSAWRAADCPSLSREFWATRARASSRRSAPPSPASSPATTSCCPSPPAAAAATAVTGTPRTARPGCR